MKFKNQVLESLEQVQNINQKIQFQINRGLSQDDILETIEHIKEKVEQIKEMVSTEDDNLINQF
jgi:hypothetical protein